jgi:hypothetical protein
MPPEALPVLAKGKHRSPRRGACFMEFASLLAGERWSDHPKCTQPVLAALARCVNDCTTDAGRPYLAPLVPDVIGTSADSPRVAPELVALACRAALVRAQGHPRFVLTVALLSAERQLTPYGGALPPAADGPDVLTPEEREAAEAYVDRFRVSPRFYRRKGALGVVQYAVATLAMERGASTDEALRHLLARAVARYAEVMSTDGPAAEATEAADVAVPDGRTGSARDAEWDLRWQEACALVGVAAGRRPAG